MTDPDRPDGGHGPTADDVSADTWLRDAVAIPDPSRDDVLRALTPEEHVAGRFAVERLAAWGGMGAVYRATDMQTKHSVALKVMLCDGEGDANRFGRESTMLSSRTHPAIVRYVAQRLHEARHSIPGDGMAGRREPGRTSRARSARAR